MAELDGDVTGSTLSTIEYSKSIPDACYTDFLEKSLVPGKVIMWELVKQYKLNDL